ncbi:hypothetical protein [Lolliginicoccus suaedae]|uniref:hypothetical protein n=1 Tax=Lolliginicoccus suaedae TaxID=2605429 RepID=UPI0011ED3905|nr:hypothetical protein [Lolliginicoccus suaedae]
MPRTGPAMPPEPDDTLPLPVPWGIRAAGAIVAAQGATCLGLGAWYAARAIASEGNEARFGIALSSWFLLLGAAVLAGGIALALGKRWGRAVAIVMQLLLLPVVFSMITTSHQYALGFGLGGIVVLTLVLMMSGRSSDWLNAD